MCGGWKVGRGFRDTTQCCLSTCCHVLQGQGLGVDFISHNARTAKRAPRRHSRSLQVLTQVLEQQRQAQEHYNATQKGHVPH